MKFNINIPDCFFSPFVYEPLLFLLGFMFGLFVGAIIAGAIINNNYKRKKSSEDKIDSHTKVSMDAYDKGIK